MSETDRLKLENSRDGRYFSGVRWRKGSARCTTCTMCDEEFGPPTQELNSLFSVEQYVEILDGGGGGETV